MAVVLFLGATVFFEVVRDDAKQSDISVKN